MVPKIFYFVFRTGVEVMCPFCAVHFPYSFLIFLSFLPTLSLPHTHTLSHPHSLPPTLSLPYQHSIRPSPSLYLPPPPPSLSPQHPHSVYFLHIGTLINLSSLSLHSCLIHTHFLLFKIIISLSSPCLLYTGWLRNYVQRKYFENCLRYENSKNYSCLFISNTSFGMVRKYTRCIQRQMTNSRFLTVFR